MPLNLLRFISCFRVKIGPDPRPATTKHALIDWFFIDLNRSWDQMCSAQLADVLRATKIARSVNQAIDQATSSLRLKELFHLFFSFSFFTTFFVFSKMDALGNIADLKFDQQKIVVVHDLCSSVDNPDNSRKGTFDMEIQNFLEFFNEIPQFVSTSSCSGRVILFYQVCFFLFLLCRTSSGLWGRIVRILFTGRHR